MFFNFAQNFLFDYYEDTFFYIGGLVDGYRGMR